MNCSSYDLKAYVLGELSRQETKQVEEHAQGCQGCREEGERLRLTCSALRALPDEEPSQRIAFVSDRVFEPRWWQRIWTSGPVMGFASALMIACAILAHGVVMAHTAPVRAVAPNVDLAQIDRRIDAEVSQRVGVAVSKAVADSETRQSQRFTKLLTAAEGRWSAKQNNQLIAAEQAAELYRARLGRLLVASNYPSAGQ